MTWDGQERRSSLQVSGPWGLRLVLVSAWSILWWLVGLILGMGVGLGACMWAGR